MRLRIHSRLRLSRGRSAAVALATAGTVVLALGGAATAAPVTPDRSAAHAQAPEPAARDADGVPVYIVQLVDPPVATYRGGMTGLPATSPAVTGAAKLDAAAPVARRYAAHLERAQRALTARIERALDRPVSVRHAYRHALNAVSLAMTADEAALVARLPGVAAVAASTEHDLDTDVGPGWIGAPGIWDGSAVPGGEGTMGEGIVIGIIDTGINFDHPSFADVGADGYDHENPWGEGNYVGFCDPEHPLHDPEKWQCNDKLIGAWSWESTGNDPEDLSGHGSHTASTAGGNFLTATLFAPTMAITQPLQGVAPHANIVSYKVLGGGSATEESIAAGIDQAVVDGVDVLSMSISQAFENPWDSERAPMSAAYRAAREAGILSAVSAGNTGPGFASAAPRSGPWVVSVAAATHNRAILNSLVDMAGGEAEAPADIVGKSLTGGYGPAPIVYAGSGEYMKEDGTPDSGQCLEAFPDGTFDGEIVVCDRGSIARVTKGANVLAGGAGGFVLANTASQGSSLSGDGHFLPAVHITHDDAIVLKEWLAAGEGHTATIAGTTFDVGPQYADVLAGFSARGPTRYGVCCLRPDRPLDGQRLLDILKPDLTAPGVDVWAAYDTDPDDPAPLPEYNIISGTSMSTPHVAGTLALMHSLYPAWTPAEIQSALLTTSVTEGVRKEDGVTAADWMDMGAGRVNVSHAANAGFVMDLTKEAIDDADPEAGGDPSSLNLATITDFACVQGCAWTRTIKSTQAGDVEWEAAVSAITDGLELTVEPSQFTLEAGASQTLTVTADVTALDPGTFAFGVVDLAPTTDDTEIAAAHMPVTVQAVAVDFPPEMIGHNPPATWAPAPVTDAGTADARSVSGYTLRDLRVLDTDSLDVRVSGVATATVVTGTLPMDESRGDPYDGPPGTLTELFEVEEGSPRLVVEIADTESPDIDVFLGIDANGDGMASSDEEVESCATGATLEFCRVAEPEAGTWWVLVQNWEASEEGAEDAVTVYYGVVPGTNPDNMTAAVPSAVAFDEPFDLEVTWDVAGLDVDGLAYSNVTLVDTATDTVLAAIDFDLVGVPAPDPVYLPDVRDKWPAPDVP